MRLKALELQGFKSFPDRTVLTFPHALTAIVGPNGSGKSNLSDAIRWVLGEQSAKTLRGGRMEDVIFGGAQDRPRQGFAQVTLTLEDLSPEEGKGTETAVTRRYYRSGESEYYLDGRQVRLKDVTERFLDTGLGQDGYALIGQGRIDQILSAKSTQRREIFEEAAGIAHCRRQEEETGHKLDQAQENLRRLQDKLDELQLQREPLRQEAERARRHAALRQELRAREAAKWLEEIDRKRSQKAKAREDLDALRQSLDQCRKDTAALYDKSEALLEDLRRAQTHREDLARQRARLTAAQEADRQALALLRAQIQAGEDNIQAVAQRRQDDLARLAALQEERGAQEQEKEALLASLTQTRAHLAQAQEDQRARRARQDREEAAWADRLAQGRGELAACRREEKAREERWLAQRLETDALRAKAAALDEMTRGYEGYAQGVRTAMAGKIPGVLGPVGQRFHTASAYAAALEAALGGAVNHILVEDEEAGKAVLCWVKDRKGGRVTCLPLTALRPRDLGEQGIDQAPGYVAIAADLVDCDGKSRPAAQALLGRTVVVDDLDHGVALARARGYRFPVVTLEGEILRPGGTMTGGSRSPSGGALARGAQAQDLAERLAQAQRDLAHCAQDLERARQAAQGAQARLDSLERPGDQTAPSARQAVEEGEETIQALTRELARLEGAWRGRAPLEEQMEERREMLAGSAQALARQEAALKRTQDQRREQAADLEQAQAHRDRQESAMAEQARQADRQVLALEGERTKTDRAARAMNDQLFHLQARLAALESKVQQAQGEEDRLLDRLWDTYGLTYTAARQTGAPAEGGDQPDRRIAWLKDQIRALGPVDPNAVERAQRVEERYTGLRDQKTDVETAKAKLEGVMTHISQEMAAVFLAEFQKIHDAFAQTFAALFGGGRGELVLEDPDHPLTTGVEIRVQPPGKTLRSLSLLSGGERALVAIALYFAMVQVHPAPFCVVDEIEAALDEANSLRFVRCLKDMAKDTQFLLITHRRATMEAAQMLYGVTMEQQGVSRVIRLDLDQVEAVLGETN